LHARGVKKKREDGKRNFPFIAPTSPRTYHLN
jgi:hypothetical protein